MAGAVVLLGAAGKIFYRRLADAARRSRTRSSFLRLDALDADRAAHRDDDLLADCKAEAGAAEAAVDAGIDLREFAEQFLARFRRDADAGVPDLEPQPRLLALALSDEGRASRSPRSVNLTALPSRLMRTWRSRFTSAFTQSGHASSRLA